MRLQLIGSDFFFKKVPIIKQKNFRALNFEPNIIKMIGYCDDPKCLITKLYERDLFSLLHDPSEGSENFFSFLSF